MKERNIVILHGRGERRGGRGEGEGGERIEMEAQRRQKEWREKRGGKEEGEERE